MFPRHAEFQDKTNYTPGVAQVVDAGHRPGWPAEAPKNPQHEVLGRIDKVFGTQVNWCIFDFANQKVR